MWEDSVFLTRTWFSTRVYSGRVRISKENRGLHATQREHELVTRSSTKDNHQRESIP